MNLLSNLQVIRWCYEPITRHSLLNTSNEQLLKLASKREHLWGNKVIAGKGGSQWTTKFCQNLAQEALTKMGRKNVRPASSQLSSVRTHKYKPDLECDDYVYEVKGRNWTTTGTAGEKILGVPMKYGEVPLKYKKPLQVILIGYQEYEAKLGFAFGDLLDPKNQTTRLKETLAFFKRQDIEYLGFTDILKKIGYPDGCWKK